MCSQPFQTNRIFEVPGNLFSCEDHEWGVVSIYIFAKSDPRFLRNVQLIFARATSIKRSHKKVAYEGATAGEIDAWSTKKRAVKVSMDP